MNRDQFTIAVAIILILWCLLQLFLWIMRRNRRRGYVYLIQAGNQYKIGHSNNPERRLAQLNLPVKGKIIHLIKSGDRYKLEKQLHRKFRKHRIRREWFDLNEDQVKWFQRQGKGITVKNDQEIGFLEWLQAVLHTPFYYVIIVMVDMLAVCLVLAIGLATGGRSLGLWEVFPWTTIGVIISLYFLYKENRREVQ